MSDEPHVQDVFSPCFCKNVRVQEYQNQVAMRPFWRRNLVAIDCCLSSEIAWLWQQGIVTHGSCCGHGDPSKAYIGVYDEHTARMRELGYQYDRMGTAENPECHFYPLTLLR